MAIVLSLLAAVTYGAADFVGGFVSKRVNVFAVVFVSQAIGTGPFLLAFPLLNDGAYSREAVLWGAAAGVGGATGVILLYRGWLQGRMSVVAPITVGRGCMRAGHLRAGHRGRAGGLALVGVVIAIVAVALISSLGSRRPRRCSPQGKAARRGARCDGSGGGVRRRSSSSSTSAGNDTGMWPLVGSRAAVVVSRGCCPPVPEESGEHPSGYVAVDRRFGGPRLRSQRLLSRCDPSRTALAGSSHHVDVSGQHGVARPCRPEGDN